MTGLPLLSVSKVRQVYRFLLTALNQWAEEEPPARIQERVAAISLYSTSQRQVKAVPRTPPVKRRRCERIMVGSGPDTYDPTCDLPAGHSGACRSLVAINQHRLTLTELGAAWKGPR